MSREVITNYFQHAQCQEPQDSWGGKSTNAIIRLLLDGAPQVRREAAVALGDRDEKAVPALLRALLRDDVFREATASLRRLGDCALPGLLRTIRDSDPVLRARTALVFAKLPSSVPHKAAEAVRDALGDPDRRVRLAAIEALGDLGHWASDHGPALAAALDDPDLEIRRATAWTLWEMRDPPRETIDPLVRALQDPDPLLRCLAVKALECGRGWAEPALPALAAAVRDPWWQVRLSAVDALQKIAKGSEDTVAAFATALSDDHWLVCETAIHALASLRKDAAAASLPLAALLKDGDSHFREIVAIALRNIGPGARAAIPALVEVVGSDDAGFAAWNALMSIGVEAVPGLLKRLHGMKRKERAIAETYMSNSLYLCAGATEALAAALQHPDPPVREQSVRMVAKREAPEKSAPKLALALRDQEASVRRAAAIALGRLGRRAREADGALEAARSDADEEVRKAAEAALKRVRPRPGRA